MSDKQPMDKKLTLIIVLWFGLILLLSGCQGKSSPIKENQLRDAALRNTTELGVDKQTVIQQNGVLVVGTAITNPFEFYDPEGDLVGLDIDIANFIAQELGVDVQFVEMSFANLIPALQENKVDMTIAAMYITPEREDLVDFSNPYIETGLVMVIPPEMKTQIKSVEDLNGNGVGVNIGSTGANYAQELVSEGYPIQVTE